MPVNIELISKLMASNADNASESITAAVREIGTKYGLSIDVQMEIGALVCDQRKLAVEAALEAAHIALADALGVQR